MNSKEYEALVNKSKEISLKWRTLPAPQRGELIRLFSSASSKSASEYLLADVIENPVFLLNLIPMYC